MEVAGGKCALKREMILFPGRERVELEHFHAENVRQIVRVTIVGRDVVLVHQAGVKGAHQRAAVLNVELEQVRFAAGQQFERRRNDQFVSREILGGPREIHRDVPVVQRIVKKLDVLPLIEIAVRLRAELR